MVRVLYLAGLGRSGSTLLERMLGELPGIDLPVVHVVRDPRAPAMRVRYERFVAAPRTTLAAVAAFAGIDISTVGLDFLADDRVTLGVGHSAAGNPMRFQTGDIPLRRDDTWVAAFPTGHRRLVGALTAPLQAAYGYRLRGSYR